MGESAGACGIAGHHVETGIRKLIEGLFQEGELQVVAGSVPLRGAVWVPTFIQGVTKHFFSQGGLAADHNSGHPSEFGISLAVTAQGVGATVTDGDKASAARFRAGTLGDASACYGT